MPNTEVKLLHAESSWWETACEGRKLPRFFYSGLAQLVEHLTVNQVVVSSSLSRLIFNPPFAGVAELADALDLGSSGF